MAWNCFLKSGLCTLKGELKVYAILIQQYYRSKCQKLVSLESVSPLLIFSVDPEVSQVHRKNFFASKLDLMAITVQKECFLNIDTYSFFQITGIMKQDDHMGICTHTYMYTHLDTKYTDIRFLIYSTSSQVVTIHKILHQNWILEACSVIL